MNELRNVLRMRKLDANNGLKLIRSAREFLAWLLVLYQQKIEVIGLDTEFQVLKVVPLKGKNKNWQDMENLAPLLLTLVARINTDQGVKYHGCAIDVGKLADQVLRGSLSSFFNGPYIFSCHWWRAEFSVLQKLGLPLPREIHDSFHAERYMTLGKGHPKNTDQGLQSDTEEENLGDYKQHSGGLSLVALCSRYGVRHKLEHRKQALVERFSAWGDTDEFMAEDLEYAIEDARVSADLYHYQMHAMVDSGDAYPYVRLYSKANAIMTEMS